MFAIIAEDMHARLFFRHVGIVRENVVTCTCIYANTIDLLQNIKSTFYGEDSLFCMGCYKVYIFKKKKLLRSRNMKAFLLKYALYYIRFVNYGSPIFIFLEQIILYMYMQRWI